MPCDHFHVDMANRPAEPLGKVLDFMRLIWALDHGLQSLSKRMQASIGLTGPQRVALRVLGRRAGISAGALAAILRVHPSTLTGVLHRLEEKGLVRRTRDSKDRRRTLLDLTSRGRRLDVPLEGPIGDLTRSGMHVRKGSLTEKVTRLRSRRPASRKPEKPGEHNSD